MAQSDVELLRGAWDAFARGDVDAATQALDPQVRWYAAGDPGGEGACHNREEAAAFLRRALAEGLTAELLDVRDAGERLVAVIHTHAPPEWERSAEPHGEVITVRDGRVVEMVIYATVEDALAPASTRRPDAGLGVSPRRPPADAGAGG
jgi:ketosteroid isomerase-like protein